MNEFFNKYTAIILSFYAFWLLGLPFIFTKTLPVLCEKINSNSKYKVEIENPKLYLNILPNAVISADKLEIKGTEDSVSIEKPYLKIRLLPLLSGHIHLNKVSASNMNIASVLKKNPELDKNFFTELSKNKFKCDAVEIKNFKVELKQKNIEKPILYTGHDIYFRRNGRYIKLNLNSEINIKDSVSTAKINLFLPRNNDVNKSIMDVKIKHFDIAPLGDYLKQYVPKDLKDIYGIIDINVDKNNLTAVFKDTAVIMKDSAKSIILPDVLNINSKFSLTRKVIDFEKIDVKSKNINAAASGSLSNYLDKPLTMIDLNVQLNHSKVEDIVAMLPPIIVEEFNVYKLKHYKFYGDTIGNFKISGDVFEPSITGDVFIDNGVLISPIKNARGATIKLKFTGKYLNFDVNVPAGGSERVIVKGGVELYNIKYADMHIKSTLNVDLATAEEKVVPIHEILNFIIGPVPIMDVKGTGNIDMIVKGNRKDPHVWGVLNFHNVTTYFNEMPDLILQKGEAVLKFDDKNAVFTTETGEVNGKHIDIKGICNLEGKFDFDVNSAGQEIGLLYKAIQTSTMIEDVKKMLPKLELCQGPVNLKLKVFGQVKYIEDLKFNKNFYSKGCLNLLGCTFGMQGVKIHNTKGNVDFDSTNAKAGINANIGQSNLSAKAEVKNNIANIALTIPKLNLKDLMPFIKGTGLNNDMSNIFVNVSGGYNGRIDVIEYEKADFDAKILGTAPQNKLKITNGHVKLKNNKLNIENLNGSFLNTPSSFNINLTADDVSKKPRFKGNIILKDFELNIINALAEYVPKEYREYLQIADFEKGKVNLRCNINNNKLNAYTDLGGLTFKYTPMNIPVKIINGSLIVRNNNLRLNKINLLADEMPLLIDGEIFDMFSKQAFDIYFNSKPRQDFIDKYINKNQIYPIKIKGDIVYSAKLKGVKDNFNLKADVNMAKDSSIYHLGATVGDVENAIVLNLDTRIIKQNILKIREFSYDKLIPSQSGRQTRLNMLKANGGIEVFKDDLAFHDLYIKTQNPTDARIFNIIFRKPNIKQGQFTSDLRFNGRLSNPKLLGNFHIFETNIPFLDTTMKNITFVFKDKTIELSSIGEILGNDITINGVLRNKLTPPYYIEKASLQTKLLDINYIINKLKLSQVENYQTFESFEGFDLSSVVVKNINLNADSIHLRNIVAENFKANASMNEVGMIDVSDFQFNIANGFLNGKFKYNLADSNTGIKIKAKNIDANALSIALFDLTNQLYGDMTGDIKLSCNGSDFNNCMKTLNGKTSFDVSNGRMPKLGSLEYLLKAGNLLKGGFTGVSINSIIDIITPLKTGEFSNIHGDINIKDGIADAVEITTKGRDLSLFIAGKYNFSTADAEMEVFGLLSKKISTMFGPIGNLSLNTLFNSIPGVDLSKDSRILEQINKIPGIELSSKAYRRFVAEIKGNINGEDYVTSFKWVN